MKLTLTSESIIYPNFFEINACLLLLFTCSLYFIVLRVWIFSKMAKLCEWFDNVWIWVWFGISGLLGFLFLFLKKQIHIQGREKRVIT